MSANDFDFCVGRWTVRHRRLVRRLAGCTEWAEFGGTSELRTLLDGQGNVDDNVIDLPEGSYRAISLRTWDPATRLWSIWWIDARHPHRLDPPVVGRFEGGTGLFECDDVFDGRPIRVRYCWSGTDTPHPRWQQAFSADGGRSWETNWEMTFSRRT